MTQFNDDIANEQIADLRRREEEKLMQALAPQYGIDYIDLRGYTINPDALAKIDERTAKQADVAAFELKGQVLSLAIHRPNDPHTTEVMHLLERRGFQILPYLVSGVSIEHAHKRYADQKNTTASKRGILDINPDDIKKRSQSIENPQHVHDALQTVSSINSPRQVSETLELIFAGALALRASDIHIEPEESSVRLRYRLDGVLIDIAHINQSVYGRLISRLKLLSGMVLNQKQEAQDGRFQFVLGEREIEVRASSIPGSIGESMVMRLLDPGVASFSIEKLDLNPYLARVMSEQLQRPNGLIITTGPTGSGKTTALYAFLQTVHDSEKKIITIENPVEYKLEGIVQTQVGPDYTFASGLRAILRQDPDIIMIGEIRDHEVAETAIHAAQTGHLVFSTLHTNSAVGGFPRLIDLGIDARILSSSVNIILGQRLVRVLCKHCKQSYTASENERRLVEIVTANYPDGLLINNPLTLYRGVGCDNCGHTGYSGRIGVFEAIVIDDAVEDVVIRDPREHIIKAAAAAQKIPTMAHDGMVKVLNGTTSLDELERVIDLSEQKRAVRDTSTTPNTTQISDDDSFTQHIVKF